VARSLVLGVQGHDPRRGDEFYTHFYVLEQFKTQHQKHNANNADELERHGFLGNRKHVSQSMMIKAKIIMKERVWINRMINETTSETHCEATGYLLPVRQHRNVEDCRVHRTERGSMVSIRTVAVVTLDFRRRRSLVT